MAIRRIESSNNNLAFCTPAHSPAEEDTGKNVSKRRYTEREIKLMKMAQKFGVTTIIKRIESGNDNLDFDTPVHSSTDEDARKNVTRPRCTERKIALIKMARKLGMTFNDMHNYLVTG